MAEMTEFLLGDRVRHFMPKGRRALLGTVVSPEPEPWATQLTWVNFDDTCYPRSLGLRPADLRLAGTRCIPFEQMTPQQQTDHMRIAHGLRHLPRAPMTPNLLWLWGHQHYDDHLDPTVNVRVIPHTHRKEPRT